MNSQAAECVQGGTGPDLCQLSAPSSSKSHENFSDGQPQSKGDLEKTTSPAPQQQARLGRPSA